MSQSIQTAYRFIQNKAARLIVYERPAARRNNSVVFVDQPCNHASFSVAKIVLAELFENLLKYCVAQHLLSRRPHQQMRGLAHWPAAVRSSTYQRPLVRPKRWAGSTG